MFTMRTVLVVMISIASVLVYRHYQHTESEYDDRDHYHFAKEYFIGDDDDTIHMRKPYLWVHAQGELNARNWESFGSRSSKDLNQPYLYLTIKSIREKCKESFNVFLIDDESFEKLVPKWKVNMALLPSPNKEHYRQFGLTCLLYHYGGMTVPASTLVLDDLQSLYKSSIKEKDAFTVQTAVDYPDPKFMGSVKHGDAIHRLIAIQGVLLKNDVTAEADFDKTVSNWCKQNTNLVCGGLVGVKKVCGNQVDLSELLGNNPVKLHPDLCAIYVPADEIVKRPKYAWFARLSVKQLLESDLELVKYLCRPSKPTSTTWGAVVKRTVYDKKADQRAY